MAAGPAWPIAEVVACTSGPQWDPKGEDQIIFRVLHKYILTSEGPALEEAAKDAKVVWIFLIEIGKRNKPLKQQVLECFHVLMESKAWESSLAASASLQRAAGELPEGLQAPLALQSRALLSSLTPEALARLREAPQEPQQVNVHQSIARFREADLLRQGLLQEDQESPAGDGGAAAAEARAAESGPARDQLRKGIDMVVALEVPKRTDDPGLSAFNQLRRGCLHAAHLPEVYEAEAGHGPVVLDFLVDFTKRHHRIRMKQICEVLNLLLHSPGWVSALDASSDFLSRVQQELPPDAQAAFSLQSSRIRSAVPADVLQAAEKKPSAGLTQAKKVAESMSSMRQSLFGLPPPTPAAGGAGPLAPILEAAPAQEAAPVPTNSAAKAAGAAVNPLLRAGLLTVDSTPPAQEPAQEAADPAAAQEPAQEATSPKRRSAFAEATGGIKDKLKGAAGGIKNMFGGKEKEPEEQLPMLPAGQPEGGHGLQVGDAVEVYSNSKQAWCPGTVEKVSGQMVTVTYQTPGGAAGELARKELPGTHETLRRTRGGAQATPTGGPASPQASAPGGYPAHASHGLQVGDAVEVYSNSKQAWCPGTVEKVSGQMVTVTYQTGGAAGELARKELPGTHETLRRTRGASPGTPATEAAAAAGTGQPKGAAAAAGFLQQRAQAAAAAAAQQAAQLQGAAASAGAGAAAAASQQHAAAAAAAAQQKGAAAVAALAGAGQRAKEAAAPAAAAAAAALGAAAGSPPGAAGSGWTREESEVYARAFVDCGGGDPGIGETEASGQVGAAQKGPQGDLGGVQPEDGAVAGPGGMGSADFSTAAASSATVRPCRATPPGRPFWRPAATPCGSS
ncbi:unnamed protein product [Prorocentrum cordatum]|uniref:Agenet-like domain-containing protein n=1 Tax=Prorocentrum cordatum TaxID=2364126 RepID=A0ABN9WWQ7_9DINO|nr:unnamed protein product [Polarella glacialis]